MFPFIRYLPWTKILWAHYTNMCFHCPSICWLKCLLASCRSFWIIFCQKMKKEWRNLFKVPYLFTYKAHSVIRRTLNFRRRLWQVSKMKISLKYPVIRRTQNYGKFCWPHRCTYINLLPKVTNYGASIFITIAKESHMDNSIKVTLFNSLNSSFEAIAWAKRTHLRRSPHKS